MFGIGGETHSIGMPEPKGLATRRVAITLIALAIVGLLILFAWPFLVHLYDNTVQSVADFFERLLDAMVDHIEKHMRMIYADDMRNDHTSAYWAGVQDFPAYLAALATGAGVLVAFFGITATVITVYYTGRQLGHARRTYQQAADQALQAARQSQMQMLIDLDFKLIEHPEIMALSQGRRGLDEITLMRSTAQAFGHAFLNTLDTVYDYYHYINPAAGKTHWPPWQAQLRFYLDNSPDLRSIVHEGLDHGFYTGDYAAELRTWLAAAERAPKVVQRPPPASAQPTHDTSVADGSATIREIGVEDGRLKDDIDTLTTFYHTVYVREFPDPDERESLENMCRYLRLKACGWYGQNNYHILIAEKDGEKVGLCVSDYSAGANAGIIEFLVVIPEARGSGLGKRLLDRTERVIEADAARAYASLPVGIAAEMNDPFQTDLLADNYDPFERAALWDRWGYRRVHMPYVQPALSADQAPVTTLLLVFKPVHPHTVTEIDPTTVRNLLHDYLVYAMRIEKPEENPEFARMADYLARTRKVPLQPLGQYIGRTPTIGWRDVQHRNEPAFKRAIELYRTSFGDEPDIAIDAEDFAQFIDERQRHDLNYSYHFWVAEGECDARAGGFASFFTLSRAGFGGYVVRAPKQTCRAVTAPTRVALAAVEERMRRDNPQIGGWFIECDPEAKRPPAPFFYRHGFYEVAVDYRQPPLPGSPYAFRDAPRLQLLYKPFGVRFGLPELAAADFLAAVADIFRVVYQLKSPTSSLYYQHLSRQLTARGAPDVGFHPEPER